MEVQGRQGRELVISSALAILTAGVLLFPPSAYAVEVGCFCTFVFVSIMFVIGIGMTLGLKHTLSLKMLKLSFKRTLLITVLEVFLLMAVFLILQTKFSLRLLVYLPLAFLLNYSLTTAKGPAPQEQRPTKKRAALAALSSLVLPLSVQLMAWTATVLSDMITFKEVSL